MNPIRSRKFVHDAVGAFADGAILFPIIVQLSTLVGFSSITLLLSAGIAYLISGWVFRVPMPVQPLKSIAIAAVAMGATVLEVRVAACLMGVFCLSCTVFDVDELAKRVPQIIVHGVQAALGVILVFQGLKILTKLDVVYSAIVIAAVVLIVWRPNIKAVSVLGLVAVTGVIFAIFGESSGNLITGSKNFGFWIESTEQLRWSLVFSILIPQMALTLANSVIATKDVAQRYFAKDAYRVSIKNLLYSIGIGNLLMAVSAGLPFCHGAGGLTAHYQAGARTWIMNIIIGIFLLGCATVMVLNGSMVIQYSGSLLAILLVAIGLFHLRLAKPSWNLPRQRFKLMAMIVVAGWTQNILWVLCVGIIIEIFDSIVTIQHV